MLPISSLPGEYGIGDFGQVSKFFVDFVSDLGFKIWQILPIGVLGPGNSPYSGYSAFAGNALLIDVSALPDRLLTDGEKEEAKISSPYRADYFGVREKKGKALRRAFSRLNEGDVANIARFRRENA